MSNLLDIILKSVEENKKLEGNSNKPTGEKGNLKFERDEKGILWSVDPATGKRVGRISEHGDDKPAKNSVDTIEEV